MASPEFPWEKVAVIIPISIIGMATLLLLRGLFGEGDIADIIVGGGILGMFGLAYLIVKKDKHNEDDIYRF